MNRDFYRNDGFINDRQNGFASFFEKINCLQIAGVIVRSGVRNMIDDPVPV